MRKWPLPVAAMVFLFCWACQSILFILTAARDAPETLGRVLFVDTPFYFVCGSLVCFLPVWGMLAGAVWLKDWVSKL